jgi:tripartite-type tricarboxylate transporter receptor subunit TctC
VVSRRWVIGALGAGAAGAALWGVRLAPRSSAPLGACAATTGRTITWVVPNAPGGGYDTESRMLEPFLEQRLGAEIAVHNLPGAGGIVGARTIATARPDGLTMGMVGVPGLLLASLTGASSAPVPGRDLSLLARTGRSWHVWAAGAKSAITSIDDLVRTSRSRSIVFGINEVGSANVASIAVAADLLGVPIELVAGFGGTRAASMAALRGDVDLVCFDFETIRELIAGGDLRPIMQVSAAPITNHRSLAGVPLLGGPDGLAARIARQTHGDSIQTASLSTALFEVMGSGRVVAAPASLDRGLFDCLASVVYGTLVDPAVSARAARPLDPADAASALAAVQAATAHAARLMPSLAAALRRIRQ